MSSSGTVGGGVVYSGFVGSSSGAGGAGAREQGSASLPPPSLPPSSLDPQQLAQPAYVQQHGYGPFTPVPPHPGANLRNTRPMTAPSSLAPPYFHSHHHGSHQHQPAQGMYAVQEYSPQPPQTAQPAAETSAFQYQLDHGQYNPAHDSQNQDHAQTQRERGFSLPELVGGQDDQSFHGYGQGGAVDDDGRRYSAASADDGSPSNSTFFYAPPPQTSSTSTARVQGHQPQHSYQTDDSDYRRPTTGNSVGAGAGPVRNQHGHAGAHHDPYGRPVSSHVGYDDDGYSHSPEGHDGYDQHGSGGSGGKTYNFVSQAGHASKRPRRRFDEIERLYACDYPGCSKAYGTLNHLNSHKTMQKHGPRSTPAQFKELRKAWRDNKKQQAAALARGDVPPPSLIPAQAELKAMGRQRSASNVGLQQAGDQYGAFERARPSTSAGEYHSAVPAFMTSVGTPIQAVAGAPQIASGYAGALQLPPAPIGMSGVPPVGYGHDEVVANPGQLLYSAVGQQQPSHYPQVTAQPGWRTSFSQGYPTQPQALDEQHQPVYGSAAHRPVTAPSMYNPIPAFGYAAPSATGFQAAGLAPQRPDSSGGPSPFAYMPQHQHQQQHPGVVLQAPQPRRLSLPLVGAPGSETKFGHQSALVGGGLGPGGGAFGAIQEEVGLVGGEEYR